MVHGCELLCTRSSGCCQALLAVKERKPLKARSSSPRLAALTFLLVPWARPDSPVRLTKLPVDFQALTALPSATQLQGPGARSPGPAQARAGLNDPYRDFKILAAGGLAGAVSRTATAPVDRVKMLLQVQDVAHALTIRQGWNSMVAEGTLRAFFRGNGTNVLKIAPETAIKLTFNDRIKRSIVSDLDHITPLQRMTCGALAGAVAQFAIYPLELIRTRLAVCPTSTYDGMRHAAVSIWRQEGALSFYRGLLPSLIGILPYAGVDIAAFEILKEELLERYQGTPPPIAILGAGMVSSSIAQFVSYPLALVRTRLQAQGYDGRPVKYTGMIDVLQKAFRHEGIRGLYKGILPNLAKVAPAAGISWFVFEEVKLFLGVDPQT